MKIEKFTMLDEVKNIELDQRPTTKQIPNTLSVNQVMIIMGWTRPTAYSFMKREGGHIIENGNNPQKWVIDGGQVLRLIQKGEDELNSKKSRYYAEMRKQEKTA